MSKHTNKRVSSSTPGRQKGLNCQKTELKVQFCKDNRMHRTNPKKYAQAELVVYEMNK